MSSGCGCKEVRILISSLLIPTPLVSALFAAASLLFVHYKKCFSLEAYFATHAHSAQA